MLRRSKGGTAVKRRGACSRKGICWWQTQSGKTLPKMVKLLMRIVTFRSAFYDRPNHCRKIILCIIGLGVFLSLDKGAGSYLFAHKVFGWGPSEFSLYKIVQLVQYSFSSFVTTPVYSIVFGLHDCLLSALGSLCKSAEKVIEVRKTGFFCTTHTVPCYQIFYRPFRLKAGCGTTPRSLDSLVQ